MGEVYRAEDTTLDRELVGLAPVKTRIREIAALLLVEKLRMLFRGTLVRPIDWLDLFFHVIPWAILLLKAWATATK